MVGTLQCKVPNCSVKHQMRKENEPAAVVESAECGNLVVHARAPIG